MTFKQYACVDGVDLLHIDVVDVTDKAVKHEVEMIPACRASLTVVIDSNSVYISDIRLHLLQQL